ncbi:MAG: type 1 glutamine amidotransferase [Phycisphaerales bacterium JB039]
MATLIVFQHGDLEGPGRLGATLRDHGFRLDIRRPDRDGPGAIPPDLDNVHGVVSLGGDFNVTEPPAWMAPEMALLKEAHERRLPVIGVCLGAQMLAAALGGKVEPMDGPEWGMCPVSINTTGQVETMLAGIAWTSRQFQAHEQHVSQLPPDTTLLASSAQCRAQAFKCGLRSYGFQYHFECDRATIEAYAAKYAGTLARAKLTPDELKRQLDAHYPLFARTADRLCVNIATYAFPFARLLSA